MKFKRYIINLRKTRVWHKWLGTGLAFLLFISAITGVLLALKKDVAVIQPPTVKGQNKDLANWIPLQQIDSIAYQALVAAHPEQYENKVDRMDVRPSKGVVKVLFDKGYWEVQVDGGSGKVLSIARRHSDWIEALHDGSIISDLFKLISMNILGIGLIFLLLTGLWLWYGPKKYRKLKRQRKEQE